MASIANSPLITIHHNKSLLNRLPSLKRDPNNPKPSVLFSPFSRYLSADPSRLFSRSRVAVPFQSSHHSWLPQRLPKHWDDCLDTWFLVIFAKEFRGCLTVTANFPGSDIWPSNRSQKLLQYDWPSITTWLHASLLNPWCKCHASGLCIDQIYYITSGHTR